MKIKEIVKEMQELGTIQAVTPQGEVTMKNVDGTETKMSKDAFAPTTDPKTLTMKPSDGVDVGDKVTSTDTSESQDDNIGADAILNKIADNEDWDLLYKLHSNVGNPKVSDDVRAAANVIARMYDDVVIDNPRLHPDDDFEDIYNIVLDQIMADYGSSEEEPAPVDQAQSESHHGHDRDELGGGHIGGDATDDYISDIQVGEGPEVPYYVEIGPQGPVAKTGGRGQTTIVPSKLWSGITPEIEAKAHGQGFRKVMLQFNGKQFPGLEGGDQKLGSKIIVAPMDYQSLSTTRESAELAKIKQLSGL